MISFIRDNCGFLWYKASPIPSRSSLTLEPQVRACVVWFVSPLPCQSLTSKQAAQRLRLAGRHPSCVKSVSIFATKKPIFFLFLSGSGLQNFLLRGCLLNVLLACDPLSGSPSALRAGGLAWSLCRKQNLKFWLNKQTIPLCHLVMLPWELCVFCERPLY